MGANSILTLADPPTIAPGVRQAATLKFVIADYWALTKPEVNLLIAVATCTGYCLAFQGPLFTLHPLLRLSHTLFGTLLLTSGAGALNQYLERGFDAQMRRTARRPLAAGRLRPPAVRGRARFDRKYLSCDGRQCGSESARDSCVVVLLVPLHSAQTKNSAVYVGWGFSWCYATSDRLGSSVR
jgi:hypothetical protein